MNSSIALDLELLFGVMVVQQGVATPQHVRRAVAAWLEDPAKGTAERLEADRVISPEQRRELLKTATAALYSSRGDLHKALEAYGGERAAAMIFGGLLEVSPQGKAIIPGRHGSVGDAQSHAPVTYKPTPRAEPIAYGEPATPTSPGGAGMQTGVPGAAAKKPGPTKKTFFYIVLFSLWVVFKVFKSVTGGADDAQEVKATQLDAKGDAAREQGKPEEAERFYQEAFTIRQKEAKSHPSDSNKQNDLGISYIKLGDAAKVLGKLDQAERHYLAQLTLARKLAADNPTDPVMQFNLSAGYDRLGLLSMSRGKNEEAREYFQKELVIVKKLTAAAPANTEKQKDLSLCYHHLGKAAEALGEYEEARQYYEADLAIAKKLAAADPNNVEKQNDLGITYQLLGETAKSQEKFDDALRYFEEYLAVTKRLAEASPADAEKQGELAISYMQVGDAAKAMEKHEDAGRHYLEFLTVNKKLAEADPTNADRQANLSVAYDRLGQLAMNLGKYDEARQYFMDDLAVSKKLVEADPTSAEKRNDLVVTYKSLANLAWNERKLDEARLRYDDGLAIAKKLAEDDPSNIDRQYNLSGIYNSMGQLADAQGKIAEAGRRYENELAVEKKVADADPTNVYKQHRLAGAYFLVGRIDLQYEILKQLYEKDKSNASVAGDLMESAFLTGRYAEVTEMGPKTLDLLGDVQHQRIILSVYLAMAESLNGNKVAAAKRAREAGREAAGYSETYDWNFGGASRALEKLKHPLAAHVQKLVSAMEACSDQDRYCRLVGELESFAGRLESRPARAGRE